MSLFPVITPNDFTSESCLVVTLKIPVSFILMAAQVYGSFLVPLTTLVLRWTRPWSVLSQYANDHILSPHLSVLFSMYM